MAVNTDRNSIPLSFRVARKELNEVQGAVKDLRELLQGLLEDQKALATAHASGAVTLGKFSVKAVQARNELLKGTKALKEQVTVLESLRRKMDALRSTGGASPAALPAVPDVDRPRRPDSFNSFGRGKLSTAAGLASSVGRVADIAGLQGASDVAQGIGTIAQAAQQAVPLITGLGGSVAATAAAAGIAGAAIIALAIVLDKFVKDIKQHQEDVSGAIGTQRSYYELVKTGTTESIKLGLEELKVKQAVAAAVRADLANAEKFAQEQYGIFAGLVLSVTGVADEAKKTDEELNGLTSQISTYERALKSNEVAARDAARAEEELNKERAGLTGTFTQQQLDAWQTYNESLNQINKQYGERRKGIEERIAQAALDARDAVAAVEADARDRRVQEVADFNKRETRELKQHHDDMEKMERDHNIALGDAAARLDAVAFLQEQRDYANKKKDAEKDADDAKKQRAEDMRDRLALEKKGDDKRIADIRARLTKEEAAARAQLSLLDSQLRAEIREREDAFRVQYNQLAGHLNNQIGNQRVGLAVMEIELRNWYNRQIAMFGGSGGGSSAGGGFGGVISNNGHIGGGGYSGSYASGGTIPKTGMAYVHAGEEVLRGDVARSARAMMGGQIDQSALLGALKGGKSGAITVNPTIVLGDVGNRSDSQLKGLVRQGIVEALRDFNEGII